jgi:hypothetical protein
VIHGVTGGILDELQGGNFGHGFINAGVNKFLNTTLATDNIAVDAVVTALIGGSLAEVTGGDFANGALTAAMQYAFNGLVTAIGGVVSETVDAASGGEFDGAMVAGAFKDGYDGEGKGVFWTVVEDGLTVIPFSKAGQGVVAATKGLVNAARGARASTPIGQWSTVAESMTARAASYQARISGRGGEAFVVNGVKFDGVRNGVLLDAKGPGYARFVRDGEFRPWWRGAEALVSQARRQLAAARGAPIQWHFAEESAASATRALLQGRGISGIDIVVTP